MNHSYTLSPNKTPVNMSREYIARFESRTLFSFLSYERRTLVARELTNHDINIYIYIYNYIHLTKNLTTTHSRREFHTHLHLNQVRVKFLSYIKNKNKIQIMVLFGSKLKTNLFYYSTYFCYYLQAPLHFSVLFMGSTVLFQLTFTFIYSTFSKKISVSTK